MKTLAELKIMFDNLATSELVKAQKRYDNILLTAKNANNNLAPTSDHNGRLHAPVNGYWWLEKVYGAGEFLQGDEEFDIDACLLSGSRNYPIDLNEKLLVDEEVKNFLTGLDYSFISFGFGKSWDSNLETYCYCYVTGYICAPTRHMIESIKSNISEREDVFKAKLKANKGIAPVGRENVRATILKVKPHESMYGSTLKIVAILENKSTVYGTLPSCIAEDVIVGSTVEFTATFKHADNDNTHAFYSRPTKAKVIRLTCINSCDEDPCKDATQTDFGLLCSECNESQLYKISSENEVTNSFNNYQDQDFYIVEPLGMHGAY